MLKIKSGAKVNGLTTHMLLAIMVAKDVYAKYGVDCVITEGTGGSHGYGSLHYVGNAIDLRTRDFGSATDRKAACTKIREALGSQYDVVDETDHFHTEFQPK